MQGWLKAAWAAARREAGALRASPWDLAMLSWIPLGLCALMAWIFWAGIPRQLPLVIVDADRTSLSRNLARLVDAAPGLRVAAQRSQWDDALEDLRERRAFGILVVPEGFARDLQLGRSVRVPWFTSGQFQTHAGSMTREVRAAVATFSAGIEIVAREKRGAGAAQARIQFEPVSLRLATLYNENASYEPFLAVSLIPALLQIFITLGAVAAVGRELKAGSVPVWLANAEGRWGAALAGKLLWTTLAAALWAALFIGFYAGVLGWRVEGSLGGLLAAWGLLIAAQLALGVLLVGATLSLRMSFSLAAFITAPAFAFAGQGFPLLAMPAAAQAWATSLPLTHFLQLQTRHWLMGAPARYGAPELAQLIGLALLMGSAGFWSLRLRAMHPSAWGRT